MEIKKLIMHMGIYDDDAEWGRQKICYTALMTYLDKHWERHEKEKLLLRVFDVQELKIECGNMKEVRDDSAGNGNYFWTYGKI